MAEFSELWSGFAAPSRWDLSFLPSLWLFETCSLENPLTPRMIIFHTVFCAYLPISALSEDAATQYKWCLQPEQHLQQLSGSLLTEPPARQGRDLGEKKHKPAICGNLAFTSHIALGHCHFE